MTKTSKKLALRDFTFLYDGTLGCLTYQHDPYLILVGRSSYACNHNGLTFSWGHRSINEAVEACARHSRRRQAEAK